MGRRKACEKVTKERLLTKGLLISKKKNLLPQKKSKWNEKEMFEMVSSACLHRNGGYTSNNGRIMSNTNFKSPDPGRLFSSV